MSSIKSLFGDAMNKKVVIIISGLIITSGILSTNNINFQNKCNKEVNIVTAVSAKDNYFIIPDSSTRYLTEDDLRGLSDEQLEIARNEIYARHGYQFKQKKMKNYFNNQKWYVRSNYEITTDDLSDIEYENVMLIKKVEEEGFSNSNDYYYGDFIIPDSSTRKVSADELKDLSTYELAIARNEIYARHGYIFVSDEWKDFFVNEDWYIPTSYSVKLNSIEEYNVAMIIKEEARR
ncbi:Uncharacterised protein [Clostridium disporicum]|uniref:YARHG domain-containing protein n=3 Tax=Clostridia TaxID=186801 RepID=A0A173Z4S6_9CLOT|nr:Uncharacterised protein [Clostridium disporicum]CUN79263.1 Uncharacterised protein [Clostridium disporicum]